MKKVLKTYPDKCIACHVCESACANLYFRIDDPERSCIRITETAKLPEMNVCNQCETCVAACPTLALTITPQGVVMVTKKLCIGCYMCVAICPTGSMQTYHGGMHPFKCIACGVCTKSCPVEAIRIVQE
ncbi:MAG: 4Fe-4S binding protein [Candidatus Cloacimonadaceae bacterium]|nr:4Fe-4S binding protein [Candidatus Cloacimonadaceae bacterium]MDP3115044.1 4Fe-4S binding protein [Candidatus Cloacimonadaceae bacterium]